MALVAWALTLLNALVVKCLRFVGRAPVSATVSFKDHQLFNLFFIAYTSNSYEYVRKLFAFFKATTVDPCNIPSTCAANGLRLPDPTNCTRYYYCDLNLRWSSVTCTAGTLFDSVTLRCVAPINATCQEPCDPVTGTTTTPMPSGKR